MRVSHVIAASVTFPQRPAGSNRCCMPPRCLAALGFGEFGVILDAAPVDSVVTVSFDSQDCDADYRDVMGRGAETIEEPQDRPWGARAAYLSGPGGITVEIEQVLKRT